MMLKYAKYRKVQGEKNPCTPINQEQKRWTAGDIYFPSPQSVCEQSWDCIYGFRVCFPPLIKIRRAHILWFCDIWHTNKLTHRGPVIEHLVFHSLARDLDKLFRFLLCRSGEGYFLGVTAVNGDNGCRIHRAVPRIKGAFGGMPPRSSLWEGFPFLLCAGRCGPAIWAPPVHWGLRPISSRA